MRCGAAAVLVERPRGPGAAVWGVRWGRSSQQGASGGAVWAGRRRWGQQIGAWEAGGRRRGSHSCCGTACGGAWA